VIAVVKIRHFVAGITAAGQDCMREAAQGADGRTGRGIHRRLGRPQDVVPMVPLLASPLSSWTTGQIISVNGGYAMP
jgi:NAD(P)-dependent dehydrogenase (short-subunit alcohol dehydrogenase family)